MARLLRMPEVAANAAEAVLQGWSIAENTPFAANDVIATIETEKAVVDVEADADGVILKTLVPEGAGVGVGTPIALIGEPGEKVPDLGALLAELGVVVPGHAAAPRVAGREVVGREVAGQGAAGEGAPSAAVKRPAERVFASPLARRMAKEAGIPVAEITGTGPGGRIVRRDVAAAIAGHDAASRPLTAGRPDPIAAPVPDSPPASTPSSPTSAVASPQAVTDVPHTRIRRAIASRLTESKHTVPHFYLRGTARADRLLELRRQLNDGGPVRISVNDLLIKAVAGAHLIVPAMNVIWTPDAVRSFSSVDVSVAVATERGLVTPVLRSVERSPISSVASTVRDFVERAKGGRLRQDELEGGTITVTNLGMFGTEDFAAIINPPQAAILAVGAARQEPIVENGTLQVGTVLRVTLSVDHRPVDGTVAAEWMKAFLALVENPVRILA